MTAGSEGQPVVALVGEDRGHRSHQELNALRPLLGVRSEWVATDSGTDLSAFENELDALDLARGLAGRGDHGGRDQVAADPGGEPGERRDPDRDGRLATHDVDRAPRQRGRRRTGHGMRSYRAGSARFASEASPSGLTLSRSAYP